MAKSPKRPASPRCHVCGNDIVEDRRSGLFRHRRASDCPFQPGQDIDEAASCRILAAFGYPKKDCKRLLKAGTDNTADIPDASNLQKLTDLLLETPWGLAMDWRGDELDEEYGFLPWLARVAAGAGVQIDIKVEDEEDFDAVALTVKVAGRRARRIKGPTSPGDVRLPLLADLGKQVETATEGRIVTRVVRIYEPSDTWGYVVMPEDRWRAVEDAAGDALRMVFMT